MALLTLLPIFSLATVPPHVPNVWGGDGYGKVLSSSGNSGLIFAFSGADGETREGTGFVGLLLPQTDNQTLGIRFLGGDATLELSFSKPQDAQPNFVAVSSDVFVANSSSDASEQIVLGHMLWNVLVGRAPVRAFANDLPSSVSKSATNSPVCNISGTWETDKSTGHKMYTFAEDSNGSFIARSKHPVSWTTAKGHVLPNGSFTILFDNNYHDTGTFNFACDLITWASGHGYWARVAPTPTGCSKSGQMALCVAKDSDIFVAAYGPDAVNLASATLSQLDPSGVDAVVAARLAAFDNMAEPGMNSSQYDYLRLANKVYSVMRVNTLSPEGVVPVHWSTPDKVCVCVCVCVCV